VTLVGQLGEAPSQIVGRHLVGGDQPAVLHHRLCFAGATLLPRSGRGCSWGGRPATRRFQASIFTLVQARHGAVLMRPAAALEPPTAHLM
jgi:hypothetical protein